MDMSEKNVGEQTIKKWEFLEKYLNAYTTIVSCYFPKFYYIDAFCGKGKYDGFSGSPLIALSLKFPFTNYVFIDSKSKNIVELKKNSKGFLNRKASTCRKSKEKEENIEVDFVEMDANKFLKNKLNSIPNVPAFIFLDPNGIEELDKDTVEICSKKSKVELLINFSVSGVVRNADNPKCANMLTKLYGSEEWKKIHKTHINRGELFAELYIKGLKNYFKFCLSEVIRTSNRVPIYYLIFVTNNESGYKIMKHVMGLKYKQVKLGSN